MPNSSSRVSSKYIVSSNITPHSQYIKSYLANQAVSKTNINMILAPLKEILRSLHESEA